MSSTLNRRDFARQLLGGVGATALAPSILSAAAGNESSSTPKQPNIVYILSDQHAYQYCGFMGHPIVRTPNLDRIAQRGVIFRNTYCGHPLCAPSRAGMLSGVYPSDVNAFCNATVWDGSLPAWPALMRDAGYHTFGCGKMDVNDKFDMGFVETESLGNEHETKPDITSFFRRPLCSRIEERPQVDGWTRKIRNKGDETHTEISLAHLKKTAALGKPWLMYTGFHMPHPSFTGFEKHYNYYLNRTDLPNIPPGHIEGLHFVYQQLRHFKNIATPIPEERLRRARAGYFAMITELDENIGRLWAALEETKQLDNTIFIYTSDHGEALGEHGLWFKNNLFENAARVPMVIAGPGIPRGKVVETPVAHVDLIRTFLEWGGAKTHAKLRGHSLIPLMRGEAGDHPGWAFTEVHSEGNCTGSFMIRKGDWKYIHFTWFDGLLFNLADDPGEFTNRLDDPAAAEALKELRAILMSTIDPVEVTQRGFATQQKRFKQFTTDLNPGQVMDQFRNRLGEGQSETLLTGYYAHTFSYEHKKAGGPQGYN